MDIQRIILFVALGLVSMMLLQNWQTYQAEKNPPLALEQSSDSSLASPDSNTPANITEGVPDVVAIDDPIIRQTVDTTGELINVNTDLLNIKIDTLGGSLSYAGLTQHPVKMDQPDVPIVLFQDNRQQRYLAQSGLTDSSTQNLPNHHTQYQAAQLQYDMAGNDTLVVPLSYTSPEGVEYIKIFTFSRDSYRIDVRYQIKNNSAASWKGHFYGHLLRTEPDGGGAIGLLSGRMPSFTGGAYYTPDELYNKMKFSELAEKDGELPVEGVSGWAAMLQHYFVSAWLPNAGSKYRFYNQSNSNLALPEYKLGFLDLRATSIAPGEQAELGAALYVGPKERDRLDAQQAQGLSLTVDFGWLTVIAEPLFWLMRKINGVVGNWGWTIILITVLIKAAFLPLSAASYKSMAKMKRLSPRLKTLKERYGDDKKQFQQEMMKLYKEEKVNPAGGCLPILVQIPVFIALYWVLLESVELRHAPWAMWIQDLSSKDPYYILPLLMGGSMVIQQLLNPAPMDPMQQKIMMALPVVFTVFFLSFPAGLVLYWVVNNVLSITQQWLITRRYQ